MQPSPFYLRCYARRQADLWVAVCIDLGLAVQGDSYGEVKAKLEAQMQDYVREALTVDRAHAADLRRHFGDVVRNARGTL